MVKSLQLVRRQNTFQTDLSLKIQFLYMYQKAHCTFLLLNETSDNLYIATYQKQT